MCSSVRYPFDISLPLFPHPSSLSSHEPPDIPKQEFHRHLQARSYVCSRSGGSPRNKRFIYEVGSPQSKNLTKIYFKHSPPFTTPSQIGSGLFVCCYLLLDKASRFLCVSLFRVVFCDARHSECFRVMLIFYAIKPYSLHRTFLSGHIGGVIDSSCAVLASLVLLTSKPP